MLGKGKTDSAPADIQSRRAMIWMHPQSLVAFMVSQRWVITKNHLPPDAKFDHVFYDPQRMVWGLVVISREFKPLKVGEPMPELKPIEFRWYNPAKDGVIE